eukprot:gene28921-56976_t
MIPGLPRTREARSSGATVNMHGGVVDADDDDQRERAWFITCYGQEGGAAKWDSAAPVAGRGR